MCVQEEYESDDELGRLHCEHCYHFQCIKQWLVLKNFCPVCKQEVVVRPWLEWRNPNVSFPYFKMMYSFSYAIFIPSFILLKLLACLVKNWKHVILVMVSKLEDAFVNYTQEWVLLVNKLFFLSLLLFSWNWCLNCLQFVFLLYFMLCFEIWIQKVVMEHLLWFLLALCCFIGENACT